MIDLNNQGKFEQVLNSFFQVLIFRFVYESTGQELIFDNWHPGQPNHLDEQDCGKVHLEDNNLWFDDQCTLDNHFVCEKGNFSKNKNIFTYFKQKYF